MRNLLAMLAVVEQVLDKNTVKLVASEYDLLVVDKEEVSVTDAAKKSREFLELEDLDHAVSCVIRSERGMEHTLGGSSGCAVRVACCCGAAGATKG
jgi:uncharacterized protein YccT (UPF0319 family)